MIEQHFRKLWNDVCLSAGIPSLSADTCARILAVIYVHGNNAEMVYCPKLLTDLEYIKKRFGIDGGETPSTDIIPSLRGYIKELYDYAEAHQAERSDMKPDWAVNMFRDMYGINLYSS